MRVHYHRVLCVVGCLMAFPATNASATAIHSCYYGDPPGSTVINPTLVAKYEWQSADTFWLHDVRLDADIFQNESLVAEQAVWQFTYWTYTDDSIGVWISNVGSYSNYRVAGDFSIRIYYWLSGQAAPVYASCTTDIRPLIPQ